MEQSRERVRKEKVEEEVWKDKQRRLGEEHVSRQAALKEANKLKKLVRMSLSLEDAPRGSSSLAPYV